VSLLTTKKLTTVLKPVASPQHFQQQRPLSNNDGNMMTAHSQLLSPFYLAGRENIKRRLSKSRKIERLSFSTCSKVYVSFVFHFL
jgi:hypothetical protein